MISSILKTFAVLAAIFAVLIVGVLSGAIFKVWPTSLSDKDLQITTATIVTLNSLKEAPKFLPDKENFYPGAPNEIIRLTAENKINDLIDRLINELPTTPKKSFVLKTFKNSLPSFDEYDSEERDQALTYYEKIMKITNTTESNEILNVWRYGLPFGRFNKKT